MMTNATSLPVLIRIQEIPCGSNLDQHTPTVCHVAYWLLRTCPFILILVGTIGNLLNLLVLSRPQMQKQSTSILLMFLAVSDTVVLWNGQIRSTLMHGWGKHMRDMSAFTCATQELFMFLFGHCSVWFMGAISLERMLLTKFPVAARAILTRRRAVLVCMSMIIICTILTIHIPFGKTFQKVEQISQNNETADTSVYKCMIPSGAYLHFYMTEWSLIKIFSFSIVPNLVIFCCNAIIIWTLFMQRRRVRPTGNNPRNETTASNDRSKALTRMIVLISVYYLITSTPFNIFTFYVGGLPHNTPESEIPNIFFTYLIIIYVGSTNFAFNFFFYFSSGPMFKRELKKIWENISKRVQRKRGVNGVDSTTNTDVQRM